MGPILLDDLTCEGSEESILMCNYSGVRAYNCYRNEEAAVSCRAGNDIGPLSLTANKSMCLYQIQLKFVSL